MSKKAVSVTLRSDNLLWLKTRVRMKGDRSLSEALDQIITQARAGEGAGGAEARSVIGKARIPSSDKGLAAAGAHVAALFRASVRGHQNGPNPGGSRSRSRPAAPRHRRA